MATASSALFSTVVNCPSHAVKTRSLRSSRLKPTSHLLHFRCLQRRSSRVGASVSVSDPRVDTGRPDDLVASILSKVLHSDGGVSLEEEEHKQVAEVAQELQKYCVSQPVKSPLIFGEWDVVYCSNPTSPGGGYRSALGRVFFRTKEMIQALEGPDTVRNKVSFSALGFIDGEVLLKGKLKALDDRWIQVIFEPPKLKVAEMEFQYGGESEVKLQITYIDETIRLGKGSRGSLFVFRRRQ
ncbi:probable plastid-lipid-associated protein 8, chloroplastic [Rhodamnia argentea]|uniref:Probable plastid-lipid-associated protein 8, chloroplastic n=1 Tax=Rhodamnia argentea TaxID=178133 RepID=A0A8B8Q2K9_9MYRT|nr:probable plastid-lipid-associated protein 8, chloroplastic [Rhodamnia argentea]